MVLHSVVYTLAVIDSTYYYYTYFMIILERRQIFLSNLLLKIINYCYDYLNMHIYFSQISFEEKQRKPKYIVPFIPSYLFLALE